MKSLFIETDKYTKTKNFLEKIIKLNQSKVVRVTAPGPSFSNHNGFRMYTVDEPIYIIFDNGMCLIIEYYFIDALEMTYRNFTDEDRKLLDDCGISDYFNAKTTIRSHTDGKPFESKEISLEYDKIKEIKIRRFTKSYSKWIDNDIDFVEPTAETFDEITFVMANSSEISICPDDAYNDGYMFIYSKDATETIEKITDI